jgi:hypothetical protein
MAHDIDSAESVGGHEAVVEVIRLPAYSRGDGSLVLECSVPALVCHAIGDDFVNMTVCCHERREEENEGEHSGDDSSKEVDEK